MKIPDIFRARLTNYLTAVCAALALGLAACSSGESPPKPAATATASTPAAEAAPTPEERQTAADLSLDGRLYSSRTLDAATGRVLEEKWYVTTQAGVTQLSKTVTFDAAGKASKIDEYDSAGVLVKTSYRRFVANQVRKEFGLELVPVIVHFRGRGK